MKFSCLIFNYVYPSSIQTVECLHTGACAGGLPVCSHVLAISVLCAFRSKVKIEEICKAEAV
jgi:hypothetical protein